MGSLGVEVDRVSGVGMAMCGQDSGEACLRDPKISVIKMSNSVFFCFLFFNFWLRWVFVASCGPSLVAVSGGCSSLRCVGSRCADFSSCGTWSQ